MKNIRFVVGLVDYFHEGHAAVVAAHRLRDDAFVFRENLFEGPCANPLGGRAVGQVDVTEALRNNFAGETPFEAKVRTRLNTFKSQGDTVPVLYDPDDHDKVFVDSEADAQEAMDKARGDTEARSARAQGAASFTGDAASFADSAAAFAEQAEKFREQAAALRAKADAKRDPPQ